VIRRRSILQRVRAWWALSLVVPGMAAAQEPLTRDPAELPTAPPPEQPPVDVAPSAAPARVPASVTRACLVAYEEGQRLRNRNALRAARQHLIACSRERCPDEIAHDCDRWRAEVEQSLPSVVVVAQGPRGEEVTDVRVTFDGELLAVGLDGTALVVDPGAHVLRYERHGFPPVEERIVVRTGEKNRRLLVRFAAEGDSGPVRPVPVSVYVFGGIGAAALASFTIFAVKGTVTKGELEDCRPHCPTDEVSALTTEYLVADVSLGVALASLAAATVLYLTRPEEPPRAAGGHAPELRLDVGALLPRPLVRF
jgi:hypothetical protein